MYISNEGYRLCPVKLSKDLKYFLNTNAVRYAERIARSDADFAPDYAAAAEILRQEQHNQPQNLDGA